MHFSQGPFYTLQMTPYLFVGLKLFWIKHKRCTREAWVALIVFRQVLLSCCHVPFHDLKKRLTDSFLMEYCFRITKSVKRKRSGNKLIKNIKFKFNSALVCMLSRVAVSSIEQEKLLTAKVWWQFSRVYMNLRTQSEDERKKLKVLRKT